MLKWFRPEANCTFSALGAAALSQFVGALRSGRHCKWLPARGAAQWARLRLHGASSVCIRCKHGCCLTLRSRRGPTACHQAREAVGHIIGLAGLAPHRRSRLTSNVRRRLLSQLSNALRALPASLRMAAHWHALPSPVPQERLTPSPSTNASITVVCAIERRAQPLSAALLRLRAGVVSTSTVAVNLFRFVVGATPNQSVNATAIGVPPGPRGVQHYHPPRGPVATPLSARYLKR